MRLALLTLLLVLAAAPAHAAPPAKVRTAACLTGLEAEERSARFEGDMRTIPGATRLQMRFRLQARPRGERRWTAVEAPGFGAWTTSVAGIGRFVYVKNVERLLAPAAYRAIVHFRWLSPGGRTLQRARRVSRPCRQPDLRPDLVIGRLVRDGDGYALTVTNEGRSAAEGVAVTIETGGRIVELGRAGRLAAGERATVRGVAPQCRAGETLTLRVDPEDEVDEADELANTAVLSCPVPDA